MARWMVTEKLGHLPSYDVAIEWDVVAVVRAPRHGTYGGEGGGAPDLDAVERAAVLGGVAGRAQAQPALQYGVNEFPGPQLAKIDVEISHEDEGPAGRSGNDFGGGTAMLICCKPRNHGVGGGPSIKQALNVRQRVKDVCLEQTNGDVSL